MGVRSRTFRHLHRVLAVASLTAALPSLWFRTYGTTLSNQEDWPKNSAVADHDDDHCYESFEATRNQWANFNLGLNFNAGAASATAATAPAVNQDTKNTKEGRVAVCVTGQPRTLNMSTTDPDFPPTWAGMRNGKGPAEGGRVAASIQQKLFSTLEKYGFDVFMYVSARPAVDHSNRESSVRNPEPGNRIACEPLRPQNTSNRLFCTVRLEPDLPVCIPKSFENYHYAGDYRKHVQLLIQLQDQLLCLRQVEEAMMKNGLTYSHIIRLRPDTQIIEPFPALETLHFGQPGSRNILYHSKKHCCCGNEDIFGIGTFDVMKTYFSRYNTLQGLPTEIALSHALKGGAKKWTAENFLEGELNRVENANLMGHDAISMCVVKPVSRRNTGDP